MILPSVHSVTFLTKFVSVSSADLSVTFLISDKFSEDVCQLVVSHAPTDREHRLSCSWDGIAVATVLQASDQLLDQLERFPRRRSDHMNSHFEALRIVRIRSLLSACLFPCSQMRVCVCVCGGGETPVEKLSVELRLLFRFQECENTTPSSPKFTQVWRPLSVLKQIRLIKFIYNTTAFCAAAPPKVH